jgi:hypothetical protein
MIGIFEGALSSRRKRAAIIIRRRGNKSRKSSGAGEKCRLFPKQQKRGKMISCVEAFSSRRKKDLPSL